MIVNKFKPLGKICIKCNKRFIFKTRKIKICDKCKGIIRREMHVKSSESRRNNKLKNVIWWKIKLWKMKKILEKKCIICEKKFLKRALKKERGEIVNMLYHKRELIRPSSCISCSNKCSKIYRRVSDFIKNRKNTERYR